MTRIEIDAYSDFVCPSCFIGSRCLRAAPESFGRTGVVTRHLPYLLSPNVSDDGIDLRASIEDHPVLRRAEARRRARGPIMVGGTISSRFSRLVGSALTVTTYPPLVTAYPIWTTVIRRTRSYPSVVVRLGACWRTPLSNERDCVGDTERVAKRYKTKPLAQSETPARCEQAV